MSRHHDKPKSAPSRLNRITKESSHMLQDEIINPFPYTYDRIPDGWQRRVFFDVSYLERGWDNARQIDVTTFCQDLVKLGYSATVVSSNEKDKPIDKYRCFSKLRHSFIILQKEEEQIVIIDPNFRDQFVISRPTEKYEKILSFVPRIFIGDWALLFNQVLVISGEMTESFKEKKISLPPWRRQNSILSKWRNIIKPIVLLEVTSENHNESHEDSIS